MKERVVTCDFPHNERVTAVGLWGASGILMTLLMLFLSSSSIAQCEFGYRKDLVIQASQVAGSGSHTDFPILVNETDLDLRHTGSGGHVQNVNGYDIRFYDNFCNQLDHQIEKYVSTTGEFVAWVRIPSLSTSQNTTIHMMYGDASLSTDPSTNAVWDANYIGVWHMNQDPTGSAPQITEFSGGGNNGTCNGSMTAGDLVSAQCGDGLDFDGSNDYVNIGDVLIDGTTAITVEAWIFPHTLHSKAAPSGHNSNEGAIVHKSGGSDDNLGLTTATPGGATFYIDDGSDNTIRGNVPALSTWEHVVGTWDNSTMRLYQDGSQTATVGSVTGSFVNNNNHLRFGGVHGAGGGNPHSFDGLIDEIRISNIARSANWVTTTYNSTNNPSGTFYTKSAEVDMNSFTSAANGDWHNPATWTYGVVPMCGDSVIIRHDVTLTSGHDTVCDLTIVNSSGVLASLDMSGGYTLEVGDDVYMIANSNGDNVELITSGNNTTLDIADDLIVDMDAGERVLIDMSNNSTIDIADDFIADLDGATSEDLRFDLACTPGTNHFYVHDDFTIDKDNAQEIQFNMSNDAELQVDGDFSIDWDGANANDQDVHFDLGDDSRIDVDGNFDVNVNETVRSGADILVDMDNDAVMALGTAVTNPTTFTIQDGNELEIQMDRNAAMNCAGDFTMTQGGDGQMDLLLNNNNNGGATDCQVTVGRNMLFTKDDGTNFRVWLNEHADIDIAGTLTVDINNHTSGTDAEIEISDDAGIDCDGAFTATMNRPTNAAGSFIIDMDNDAFFNIGTANTDNASITVTEGLHTILEMDRDAAMTVAGDLTIAHDGDGQLDILLNNNNNGTGADAQLTVGDDFTLTKSDGDRMFFTIRNHSDVDIAGDFTYTCTNHDGSNQHNELNLQEDATFDADGNVSMSVNTALVNSLILDIDDDAAVDVGSGTGESLTLTVVDGNDLEVEMDRNGSLDVFGNMTMTQGGNGNMDLDLDVNANGTGTDGQLNVNGNLVMNKTDGDRLRLVIREGSDVSITGDLTISDAFHEGAGQNCEVEASDASTLDVDGSTTITLNSLNNAVNDLIMQFDNTAVVTFGTNNTHNTTLTITEGSAFDWDQDRDASVTITGDLDITQNGDGNCDIDLDVDANGTGADAQLSIAGDLLVDKNDGDRFRMVVRQDSDVDIDGSLNIDDGFHEGATQHCEVEVSDAAGLDVDGTTTVNLNSLNNAANDLIMQFDNTATVVLGTNNTQNTTLTVTEGSAFDWDQDRDASVTISGDLLITQAGDGNCDIDMDVDANGTGADAQLSVGDDMTVTKTDGDRFRLMVREGSDLDIAGDLTITNTFHEGATQDNEIEVIDQATIDVDGSLVFDVTANNNASNSLIIDMDDNASITVGTNNTHNATIRLLDGNDYNFHIDRDAVFSVTGDLTATQSGDGNMDIDLNNNANGSTTDGQITVGDDLTITKDDGDRFRIFVHEHADISVAGDMTVSTTFHEGASQHDEIEIVDDGFVDVEGSFSWTWNSQNNIANDLELDMDNNGRFDVGPAAGPYTTESMDFIFNGSGDDMELTLDRSAMINAYGDMTFTKNGADEVELFLNNNNASSDAQVNVYDDLVLNNAENADMIYVLLNGTNSLLDVDGDIDMSSAAAANRVEIELNNSSKIEIGGSFLRTASPNNFGILDCNGTSIVEYDGSANTQFFAQDAGASSDEFDYQNVVINNTFGTTPQVTMEGLATVHQDITFTTGIVASTATNLLVVDDNATATAAKDASHVDGEVRKVGDDAFTFPVGDAGIYLPIAISAPGVVTDHFTARYNQVDPWPTYAGGLKVPTLDHISSCEYWILDRTNGSSNVNVTLAWRQYNAPAACSGVNSLPTLRVARWDGSLWTDEGNGGTTGAAAAGTIVSGAAVTSFSPFTLASSDAANPLPIDLLSFTANKEGEDVRLDWITASEINNDYFTIERSSDATNFTEILRQSGAGNSNQQLSYVDYDRSPMSGVNYYRLKQTDYNGAFTYSQIVAVDFSNDAPSGGVFTLFPNPVKDGAVSIIGSTELLGSGVDVIVHDMLGKVVWSNQYAPSEGRNQLQLLNTSGFQSGVYVVSLQINGKNHTRKLVVK